MSANGIIIWMTVKFSHIRHKNNIKFYERNEDFIQTLRTNGRKNCMYNVVTIVYTNIN